jgi:hypothetical protein
VHKGNELEHEQADEVRSLQQILGSCLAPPSTSSGRPSPPRGSGTDRDGSQDELDRGGNPRNRDAKSSSPEE